ASDNGVATTPTMRGRSRADRRHSPSGARISDVAANKNFMRLRSGDRGVLPPGPERAPTSSCLARRESRQRVFNSQVFAFQFGDVAVIGERTVHCYVDFGFELVMFRLQ